jgi:hypothetical protein
MVGFDGLATPALWLVPCADRVFGVAPPKKKTVCEGDGVTTSEGRILVRCLAMATLRL